MPKPQMTRPAQSIGMPLQAAMRLRYILDVTRTELQSRPYIEPRIQKREATWIADLLEKLSAMYDELKAPNKEPAGMAAVMPPCV